MLLCTQLAPARHVAQVGEKISTRRGCPLSRLNSDFKVEIRFSARTPPLCEEEPGPGEAAPGPVAGPAGEHDASAKPAVPAAATTAGHDLRRLRQATRIPIRFLSPTIVLLIQSPPRRYPLHDKATIQFVAQGGREHGHVGCPA